MFFRIKHYFPVLIAFVLLTSCNEYQKVLKNEDVKAKYDLAEKFYEAGDFRRANRLFEQIAPKYVGKPQGERVMFFLADTYFQTGDYNMAGYQFERFIKQYPKSDKMGHAAYLGAQSYFELSPNYSLDQTDTDKALAKLQNFVNAFGDSEYFDSANGMAKELLTKKEQKAFEIAKQYTKLGEFYDLGYSKSAISANDNFLVDYPGSIYREEALFNKVRATSNLALNSYDFIKKERLLNAKAAYDKLMKDYPETSFAKKANQLIEKVNKEISGTVQPDKVTSTK